MKHDFNSSVRDSSVLITPRVINAIKKLPADARKAVSAALADHIFLGIDTPSDLSPYQAMLLTFILDYVKRDTMRIQAS